MRGFPLQALAGALIAAAAGLSRADSPAIGTGTFVASGTKVASKIDNGQTAPANDATDDKDHYVIDGFTGQTLSVTVLQVKAKTGVVLPELDVYRPDGTRITAADGAKVSPRAGALPGKSAKLTYKLDQTGTWTIRVRGSYPAHIVKGDNPASLPVEKSYVEYDFDAGRTEGPYKLTVKYGAPPAAKMTNAVPDAAGFYEFPVSGMGGSTFKGTLSFKGGAPTFSKVLDPLGRTVPGFTAGPPKKGKIAVTATQPIDSAFPLGTYRFRFNMASTASTNVSFTCAVRLPKGAKALKGTLSEIEPRIDTVTPSNGGPSVPVIVTCFNAIDPKVPGTPKVYIGRILIDPAKVNVTTSGNKVTMTFTSPDATKLPDGTYDVTVVSTSGQAAVKPGGFRIVPPPQVFTMDPVVGSVAGGFQITITGSGFSDLPADMAIRYRNLSTNDFLTPGISFLEGSDASTLVFRHPMTPPLGFTAGDWAVSVVDTRSGRSAELPMRLTLSTAAAINRVTPALVPLKGGEMVYISGSAFKATDKVYLETAPGSGTYDEITATQTTYFDENKHQFVAPDKSTFGREGTYRVYVKDENDFSTSTRSFAYFRFEGATSLFGLNEADGYDGNTSALADLDKDGDLDLIVGRRGPTQVQGTPQTRIFLQDANGKFTDTTTSIMPSTVADDDWRAEKVCVGDVNADGYPDLFLLSNATTVPTADTKSHLRILVNEQKSQLGGAARQFRDRTIDLMAPPRAKMTNPQWGSPGTNEADDWRGKDMWVGDLDLANAGPPEIVITTDRVFENNYVKCEPYCSTANNLGYPYSFYWGGTRVMRWDQSAKGGLGRYKFDKDYFPRISGVVVPIFNPPPGITIPNCAGGSCRGTFTPFTGQRLAVGGIDLAYTDAQAKARPDVAVLNNQPVMKNNNTISSLQVALNEVGSIDGSNVTDVTDRLTSIAPADMFKADAVAIGPTGYPDGSGYGVITIAKNDPSGLTGSQSALRMIQFRPPGDPKDRADFSLVSGSLPAASAADRFHASAIAFYDVDQDGDLDLITVAPNSPGANASAFRVFRNEIAGPNQGVFTRVLDVDLVAPIVAPPEVWAGEVLTIGDLDRDGAAEYVITRPVGSGSAPHTRVIRTDK